MTPQEQRMLETLRRARRVLLDVMEKEEVRMEETANQAVRLAVSILCHAEAQALDLLDPIRIQ